jgi:hypothetical protein
MLKHGVGDVVGTSGGSGDKHTVGVAVGAVAVMLKHAVGCGGTPSFVGAVD